MSKRPDSCTLNIINIEGVMFDGMWNRSITFWASISHDAQFYQFRTHSRGMQILNIIPISAREFTVNSIFFFFNSIDRKLNPPSGKSENSQTECNSLNGTGASYQFAKLFMTFFFHDFLCMFVCHVRAERYAQSTGAFYRNPGAIHDLYHSFNATIYSIIFCSWIVMGFLCAIWNWHAVRLYSIFVNYWHCIWISNNRNILICQQEFRCIKDMHLFSLPIRSMRGTLAMAKTVEIFSVKF